MVVLTRELTSIREYPVCHVRLSLGFFGSLLSTFFCDHFYPYGLSVDNDILVLYMNVASTSLQSIRLQIPGKISRQRAKDLLW